VAQAAGWPAVIGLAALAVESSAPANDVPSALYDYFAEELLQAAEPDTRLAVCRLAVAPSITDESAAHLLGPQAGHLLADSVSTGILRPQTEGQFELHPLLQAFLQERLREFGAGMVASTVDRAGAFLLLHERWDEAVSLAQKFRDPHFLDQLINAAWEPMLDEGRLATLARLIDLASELRLRSSLLDLVEAEISFRQGSYQKAEALALEAARTLTDEHLLVRAYTRAGQSAHFEGRDEDALLHHRHAQSLARLKEDRRETLWGEFVCAIQLENSDCVEALNRLAALGSDCATDFVRLANGRMVFAMRNGRGIDPELLGAIHRLPKVEDPLIRSSFLHVWSSVLTFMGRYEEALEATEQQLREAEQYRLAFVLPHAHIRRAVAFRGLRRFPDALESLSEAKRHSDKSDDHLAVSSDATRIGLFLAMEDSDAALRMSEPQGNSASPNAVAELIAVRALALACVDRHDEARDAAERASLLSSAAEPRLLCKFTTAVSAVAQEGAHANALVAEAFKEVVSSESIDVFVTAYRGFPGLLHEVSQDDQCHMRLATILDGAHDEKLARAILPKPLKLELFGTSILSAREREVLALVSQGLRNREIAERLFISEVTVKAHVRNILKKLGARSRAHAVSLTRMD
jgi:ATP/maltotriose-dependent transcriptional regulator MalT